MHTMKALHPFQTPDAKRLAVLFGIVYFAQGMWYLPNQTITISLKDGGLSAGQVAGFFAITTVPWLIKPVYGLLSDFVPLFGYHRKSYLLLTSATTAAAGLLLGLTGDHAYWRMATFLTLMALGLAFTDVLADALMVANGKPMGLTGAFQSVQWGAITTASILVGELGGYLAENRRLHAAFFLAACFPLVSLLMAAFFVREAPARADREAFATTWAAIRDALREREVWVVGGFIFFWTFSPSFGPAMLYYQTDVLHFSQQFIGHLAALAAVAGVAGAFIYAPLSRRVPLTRLINFSIGAGVIGTLAYLVYRDPVSALVIDVVFGCVGMLTQLAFLDLAAKSCPRRVEATFFALLMSVYNGGTQISQNIGGQLYDSFGFTPLVLISAAFTGAAWLLVPLVKIDRIEDKAKQAEVPASSPSSSTPQSSRRS
jgi:predicted MFS family arabinose efflux permease